MTDKSSNIYIGSMSGTSMDGIDVCAISMNNTIPRLIAFDSYAYPKKLSTQLFELVKEPIMHLDSFGKINYQIGQAFAIAIKQFIQKHRIPLKKIKGVGLSGQTVWHSPKGNAPFSLQLGTPHPISRAISAPIVFDFRNSHIQAGGEGAPLLPPFHAKMYAFKQKSIVLNIGGISNYTLVSGASFFGSDIGPGNALLDSYCKEILKKPFDRNGKLASKGKTKTSLVEKMLQNKELNKRHPFSTGKEVFNLKFLPKQIFNLSHQDALATITEVTALSISNALNNHKMYKNIYVCGGGVLNRHLMKRLTELCHQEVYSSEVIGIHPQAIESMGFAWMTYMRLAKKKILIQQTKNKALLGSVLEAK